MKKFAMCLVGAMIVFTLVACTPTTEKQANAASTMEQGTTGGASDKVPDPNVEPMDLVSVYVNNAESTGLKKNMDAVESLDAQSLVDKLIEFDMLQEGTEVLKYEAKDGIGSLDLSQIPELDQESMSLLLASIGNTFIENMELDELALTVKGKAVEGADSSLEYISGYKEMLKK